MKFPPLYSLYTLNDSVPWVYTSLETAQATCDYYNEQRTPTKSKWFVLTVTVNQYERPKNAKI